jgi:hypothetical protein
VQRGIPWLNAHSPELLEALDLSPAEFSSLWTPILHVVASSVWNDTTWRHTSRRAWEEDTYIFSAMRWASLEIIARFANAMHSANANTRYLSVQIRLKVFKAVSPLDFPDSWPAVSTDPRFHPSTPQAWGSLPVHYPVCFENDTFRGIFSPFGKAGEAILCGLTPGEPMSSTPPGDVQTSQKPASSQQTAAARESTSEKDCTSDSAPASQEDHRPVEKPASPAGPLEAENKSSEHPEHHGDRESCGQPGMSDSEDDDSCLYSQDGRKIATMNLHVDRDVVPTRSSSMRTGNDVDKVSEDVVQQIIELVGVNNAEDCAMVQDFVRMYDPPIDYLTRRAFDLSRMGGAGLAKYAIEDLYCDAETYHRLGDYFQHRRLEALEEAVKVEEQVRVAAAAQAAAESQELAYRQMSRRVNAAKEQQLNALRRASAGGSGGSHQATGSRPTFPSLGLGGPGHAHSSTTSTESTLRSTPAPKRSFDEHSAFGT